MKIKIVLLVLFATTLLQTKAQLTQPDRIPIKKKTELVLQPVKKASLVISYDNKTVYVDPAGGAGAFEGLPEPNMILITDIGKDHFDVRTLESLATANAIFVVPQGVADYFPELLIRKRLVVFNEGDRAMLDGIGVAAVPRYSLPEGREAFYKRGKGNGYVLGIAGKNIYISGETDSIPEIKALQAIDIAFLSMNKPHSMSIPEAAETVLGFKPAIVYPYDYQSSDLASFKELVNAANPAIEVRLKDWLGEKKPGGSE